MAINISLIERENDLTASQFLKFCYSFFNYLGFSNIEIELTKDAVVMGKAWIELGGFVSYQFVVLAKQDKGECSGKWIDEIRNKADHQSQKGLLLSTGYFSRVIKKQAKVKGKLPIDLIHGANFQKRLEKVSPSVLSDLNL